MTEKVNTTSTSQCRNCKCLFLLSLVGLYYFCVFLLQVFFLNSFVFQSILLIQFTYKLSALVTQVTSSSNRAKNTIETNVTDGDCSLPSFVIFPNEAAQDFSKTRTFCSRSKGQTSIKLSRILFYQDQRCLSR